MVSVKCYQCPVELDVTSREKALQEAQKHASAYGHNVGLYDSRSLEGEQARQMVGIVLKWRRRAA